ncbi:type IV pilin protein [Colwellia sp. RSH04]|uniref:type IV pilin protein n=1 Tax=Colwellia sp. RSH04 TaxID=2305464 RepID=UPI000E56FEB8|nr:type IV pilin protein [Colwellia sp. RSH04]RHW75554.1 type IV pilin protein [Colwellia sp. RSH04]
MTNRKKSIGFTLIEMLIAVAIMGILASVAYPSYTEFITRSNRVEAQRELVRLANLQEQVFVDTRNYTEDMKALGMKADPHETEHGNYDIDATVNGVTFVLTATAKDAQAKDTECKTLTIDETGTKGGTSADCWEK